MFKIVISQSNLKSIIDAVSHITDEAKLQISPEGFKIEAVDHANVALVWLNASQGAFEYFKADNMEMALDLLKLANLSAGKDNVSIDLDEEKHKLNIAVGRSKYTMSLLDPASMHATPRIPSLDLPARVALDGSDLRDAVVAAAKVSDHVVLEQHESEFRISAKGDLDSFEMPFQLSELTGIRNGESRALFSMVYIDDISKVAMKARDVMIETGIDYPAKITFNVGESINIQYLLAPRIEQE